MFKLTAVENRKRSRFTLKHVESPESDVLKACLTYLAYESRVIWFERRNAGAYVIPEQRNDAGKVTRKRAFVRYGKEGTPDIQGLLVGGFLFEVECKRKTGAKRQKQIERIDDSREAGACALFVRSVDELKQGIDDFFERKRGLRIADGLGELRQLAVKRMGPDAVGLSLALSRVDEAVEKLRIANCERATSEE